MIVKSQSDIDNAAQYLNEFIKSNDCLAWIGSGLSKVCGYPTWNDLVDSLCMGCLNQKLSDLGYMQNSSTELTKYADKCKNDNNSEYNRILHLWFSKRIGTNRDSYHNLIKLPFKGYITTNYDYLLLKAKSRNRVFKYPNQNLCMRSFIDNINDKPVFYIHGLIDPNDESVIEIVLTETEFNNAYNVNRMVSSFIHQLYASYSIVFIGCELSDEAIVETFKKVKSIVAEDLREMKESKLIIFSINDESEYKNKIAQYEEIGINKFIAYIPTNSKEHLELDDILERCCELKIAQVDVLSTERPLR